MLETINNELHFDGLNINQLAKDKKTPFFLFSEKTLKDSYNEIVNSLKENYPKVRIDYSVKTNNELEVLKVLNKLGSCAEIAAGQELSLVEKAGFRPDQVTFDGPCKSKEDLALCLDKGIHIFNMDSLQELKNLNEVAKEKGVKAKAAFRINLGIKGIMPSVAEMYIDKFGVPISRALDAYKKALECENIEIIGISTHIGTQLTSVKPYLTAVEKLGNLAKELEKLGIDIKEINFGGGFPSQTLTKTTLPGMALSKLGIDLKKEIPSLKYYGETIAQAFSEKVRELKSEPELVFEPGRSVTSPMGIMVSKVKVVKKEEKWVFLDASTNSIPEMVFFAQREFLFANKLDQQNYDKYKIGGVSLNSADIFALNKKLPEPEVDDVVIILDAGAYSISRANRFTTLNPPVYMFDEVKNLRMIRREETYEDLIEPMS